MANNNNCIRTNELLLNAAWVKGYCDAREGRNNFTPEYETWSSEKQMNYEVGRLHVFVLKSAGLEAPQLSILPNGSAYSTPELSSNIRTACKDRDEFVKLVAPNPYTHLPHEVFEGY